MRETIKSDRIQEILTHLGRFSSGDYGHSLAISEKQDELDVISAGINQLGNALFLREQRIKKKEELNAKLEQRVLERTEEFNISEKKYRNLFENNPLPMWVLEIASLRFLDVNESAVKHYGYSREEFLAMSSVELRPKEERTRYLQENQNARGTQKAGIWKHRKKDGAIIHCEIIVHEILFEGKPGRLVLSNDVTEKVKTLRALQISEARFRRIFESKMTGFLFWNADRVVTEANDFFLRMVGYTRKDLAEGKIRIKEMTPPEYIDTDRIAMEQIRATGACEPLEKEYIRKDGSQLPVMMAAATINDGNPLNGVACVMDISQRKIMEQEIMELNRDLEIRIEERTKELQQVNKELESFSYSVSHDLRAPLRAIHGYSQMLAEDYEALLDTEGVRLLNAIKFNAKRMGQLVDDLLAFSRMNKRSYREINIDLNVMVSEIIGELCPEEKNHTKITVHPLGSVRADHTLLRQAIYNLIGNAIKYSSKKDEPRVEIGVKEIDGQTAYYIKDNGAGFDMAYYNKLFGVFQRLHEQEEFEGTGVGLAIVQRIIHRHNGKIWAEAKVDEGAVFYFTLGSAASGAPSAAGSPGKAEKIY